MSIPPDNNMSDDEQLFVFIWKSSEIPKISS